MPTKDLPDEYKRGTRVVLVEDLPGVPFGTHGKLGRAIGFDLKRYRVHFDNRVEIQSVAHELLVPEKMWPRLKPQYLEQAKEAASNQLKPRNPAPTARSGRVVAGLIPGVIHDDPPPADIEITEPDSFVPGPEIDVRSFQSNNRVSELLTQFRGGADNAAQGEQPDQASQPEEADPKAADPGKTGES